MTSTQGLPPSRGIMAVDAVKFSRNRSALLPQLSSAIPALLGDAFGASGCPQIWRDRRFPQGTGDGYVFGVPHEQTSFLLHPLLDQLQEKLAEHDRVLRSEDRDLRLRLRVAIHLGSVPDSGDEHDRIGTPTNDTFRLLDSDAIRRELRDSNPDVTLLAAIVSQRVFEEVVRAGYTPGLHPDRFRPVVAEVEEKEFAQPAWIYVPRPSHTSAPSGPGSGEPAATGAADAAAAGSTTIHGNVGNAISGGNFSGNVQQTGGRAS